MGFLEEDRVSYRLVQGIPTTLFSHVAAFPSEPIIHSRVDLDVSTLDAKMSIPLEGSTIVGTPRGPLRHTHQHDHPSTKFEPLSLW